MSGLISNFYRDETGATAIEYTLIAAMMSIAIVAAFPFITSALSTAFTSIGNNIKTN